MSNLAFVLVVAALLIPATAGANAEPTMPPRARAHYDAGMAAYRAREYPTAIKEFQAGFAVAPLREFLFAEAQAERLRGDCPRAVVLYRKFLETQPPSQQAEATQIGLNRCAHEAAARPAPPAAVTTPIPPAIAQPPPASVPWYRDRLGAGLSAGGVVGAGVGLAFVAAAWASDDAADGAGAYVTYGRHQDASERRWTAAAVGLAAGGALLGAGALRYVWVARNGGGAGIGGGF